MKIALIWPESTFLVDPMVYPPLGLWYIWAMLEAEGHTVDFYDMSDPSLDVSTVDWFQYTQAWISGTTPQALRIKYWASFLEGKGIHVYVGGPHAIFHGEELAQGNRTIVCGEVAPPDMPDLLRAGGGVYRTDRPGNLNAYPLPVRRAAMRYTAMLGGRRATTMITSLGCPFACAFCSSHDLYGGRVRYFPLDHVAGDIDQSSALGFGAIQFYDDILPINKWRTIALANYLKDKDMLWRCFMRSDLGLRNGFDFLVQLRDCGLIEVLVGVESASDRIKHLINKLTTTAQDTTFRQWCEMLGISYKASIILGLPGETHSTMQATADWLLTNRPDRVDVNVLIPMPGTPLMDRPEDFGCMFGDVPMPDAYFYKGRVGEVRAVARTPTLSTRDIDLFRADLLTKLRAEGIPY